MKAARGCLLFIESKEDLAVENSKINKETTALAASISQKRKQAQNLMKEIENAQKKFNLAGNNEQKNMIVEEVKKAKGDIANLLNSIRSEAIKAN